MRTSFVLLLLTCFPSKGQQIYDLLLKNGHVIDPANHRSAQLDIAVVGNKIERVAKDLSASHARVVVDLDGYIVSPGLLDTNVLAGRLKLDYNTLPSGVTTAVDAGSSSCKNFADLKTAVIDHSKTRVLAFVNAENADAAAIVRIVHEYPQIIVGIAARPETLPLALDAAQRSNTVVMLEANSHGAPEYADLLKRLRPGDIHTHLYSRLTPQMDGNGKLRPELFEARQRGVLFDASHGSYGLWFRIAQPALQQGFLPDTISSGMDTGSIVLPRSNMITTMSKFLNMGMSVEQIIERTSVRAARAIRRPDLGTLSEGAVADIAVLQTERGRFGFLDSGHARLDGESRLRCVLTVRDGVIMWDSDGLSIPDWIKAGPYTNFR